MNGDFRKTEPQLGYVDSEGREFPFYYAIDLVSDRVALILECKVNGSVFLAQLSEDGEGSAVSTLSTLDEKAVIHKALADFAEDPLAYDLSEMVLEKDMREMVQECKKLCEEL